ncbi:MAG: transposase, partial [Deltaproteobacteria bacterium]|nr:transposase [Deltaproteobacteria bacterium]
KRWTALTRFLDDARIPLDTNFVERGFVPTAIGRRNYIGCRSARGLFVVGIFYSVLGSAAICGKSEAAYLDYAARVAFDGGMPLLPAEWQPS